MKKFLLFIVLVILVISVAFIIVGSKKASVMDAIAANGMRLNSDSSAVTDLESKLYEMAYSLPVGSEKVGLWLEAIITKKFETFSTQSQLLTPELAEKLEGWPINRTIEIDLSGSETVPETMLLLGKLDEAEWIDLSRTQVDAKTVKEILLRAPKLQKLQLTQTPIKWSSGLVDALVRHPQLIKVEVDSFALQPSDLARLRKGLVQ